MRKRKNRLVVSLLICAIAWVLLFMLSTIVPPMPEAQLPGDLAIIEPLDPVLGLSWSAMNALVGTGVVVVLGYILLAFTVGAILNYCRDSSDAAREEELARVAFEFLHRGKR